MAEFVTAATLAEYEAFVAGHEKGHFMQSRLWGDVKDNWKWEGILSRGPDGRVRGAMAVLVRRVPMLPFALLYAGRGPVCDVHDAATLRDLVAGARGLAKKHRAFALKIDPDVLSADAEFIEIMKSLGFRLQEAGKNFEGIQPRYVFRLTLAGRGPEALMASFHQKTRYNIRLAEKKGVEVRLCGEEALADFGPLMRETGLRDGFVTREPAYFAKILRVMGDRARLYMAYYEGQAVAGTLAIHYGDKVWYLYGASANSARNVMPNYLLQWHMIQWAAEKGCRVYDFRGVSGDLSEDNPLYGLYRFKKGFNGDFCEFVGEMDLILNPPLHLFVRCAERAFRRARRARYLAAGRRSPPGSPASAAASAPADMEKE